MQGSDTAVATDDVFAALFGGASPQTFAADASSGGDVFGTSAANQSFSFSISETPFVSDSFTLSSASLTINGTPPAPIPLPAGLPLMLAGPGVLAWLRKRTTA